MIGLNYIDFSELEEILLKLFDSKEFELMMGNVSKFGVDIKPIIQFLDKKSVDYNFNLIPHFFEDRENDDEFLRCLFNDKKGLGNLIIITHETYKLKKCFSIEFDDLERFIDYYEENISSEFFVERDIIFLFPEKKGLAFWEHEGDCIPFVQLIKK